MEDKCQVSYQVFKFGRDWILMIGGGESHFGSLACSDPSLEEKFHQYTLGIHKEGGIVEAAIKALQPLIKNELIVICGIHYDNIAKDQISEIIKNNKLLLKKTKQFFQSIEKNQ